MQPVIAAMLGALHDDARSVERIGVNLANTLTPGYQREMVVGPASANRFGAMLQAATASPDALAGPLVYRDLRPGTLKSTGQAFDLALQSAGFFEVASPQGLRYTRRGDFHLDDRGALVTAQGWAVMGTGGKIVAPSGEVVAIDPAGRVTAGGRVVGQLKVVGFGDAARLTAAEPGYFLAGSAAREAEASAVSIRQGFLENANVVHSAEMVNLMATMRHFESVSRALQSYDDMVGGAIRKLGDA